MSHKEAIQITRKPTRAIFIGPVQIGGGEIDTITIGRRRLVRVPSLLKLLKMDSI